MLLSSYNMLLKDYKTVTCCVKISMCCVKLDKTWFAMYFSHEPSSAQGTWTLNHKDLNKSTTTNHLWIWKCVLILSKRSKVHTEDTHFSGTSFPKAWEGPGRADRHIVETHVKENGIYRIQTHKCCGREGKSGENRGERNWWEGDRRERNKIPPRGGLRVT